MSSSLRQQLAVLGGSALGDPRAVRKHPSLIFSDKDSANISSEQFYEIGMRGLKGLVGISSRFIEFQSTLFSAEGIRTDRAVMQKSVNDAIHHSIRQFLVMVSPHFLKPCAQQAIEYLLHSFEIYKYDAEDLLRCVLPFHEHIMFCRVLQLLELRALPLWSFLDKHARTGTPVPRAVLVERAALNDGILLVISSMFREACEMQCVSNTMLGLWVSVSVELFERSTRVAERHLRIVLPDVHYALATYNKTSNTNSELLCAALMVLCSLPRVGQLTVDLFEDTCNRLCRALTADSLTSPYVLGALLYFFSRRQNPTSARWATSFWSVPWASLLTLLRRTQAEHPVAFDQLLCSVLQHSNFEDERVVEGLSVFASNLPLSQSVVKCVLEKGFEKQLPGAAMSDVIQSMRKHSHAVFDKVLSAVLKKSEESYVHRIAQYLSSEFSEHIQYRTLDNGLVVLLSLTHHLPEMRLSAVRKLSETSAKNSAALTEALTTLVDCVESEFDDGVLAIALEAIGSLLTKASAKGADIAKVITPEVVSNIATCVATRACSPLQNPEEIIPIFVKVLSVCSSVASVLPNVLCACVRIYFLLSKCSKRKEVLKKITADWKVGPTNLRQDVLGAVNAASMLKAIGPAVTKEIGEVLVNQVSSSAAPSTASAQSFFVCQLLVASVSPSNSTLVNQFVQNIVSPSLPLPSLDELIEYAFTATSSEVAASATWCAGLTAIITSNTYQLWSIEDRTQLLSVAVQTNLAQDMYTQNQRLAEEVLLRSHLRPGSDVVLNALLALVHHSPLSPQSVIPVLLGVNHVSYSINMSEVLGKLVFKPTKSNDLSLTALVHEIRSVVTSALGHSLTTEKFKKEIQFVLAELNAAPGMFNDEVCSDVCTLLLQVSHNNSDVQKCIATTFKPRAGGPFAIVLLNATADNASDVKLFTNTLQTVTDKNAMVHALAVLRQKGESYARALSTSAHERIADLLVKVHAVEDTITMFPLVGGVLCERIASSFENGGPWPSCIAGLELLTSVSTSEPCLQVALPWNRFLTSASKFLATACKRITEQQKQQQPDDGDNDDAATVTNVRFLCTLVLGVFQKLLSVQTSLTKGWFDAMLPTVIALAYLFEETQVQSAAVRCLESLWKQTKNEAEIFSFVEGLSKQPLLREDENGERYALILERTLTTLINSNTLERGTSIVIPCLYLLHANPIAERITHSVLMESLSINNQLVCLSGLLRVCTGTPQTRSDIQNKVVKFLKNVTSVQDFSAVVLRFVSVHFGLEEFIRKLVVWKSSSQSAQVVELETELLSVVLSVVYSYRDNEDAELLLLAVVEIVSLLSLASVAHEIVTKNYIHMLELTFRVLVKKILSTPGNNADVFEPLMSTFERVFKFEIGPETTPGILAALWAMDKFSRMFGATHAEGFLRLIDSVATLTSQCIASGVVEEGSHNIVRSGTLCVVNTISSLPPGDRLRSTKSCTQLFASLQKKVAGLPLVVLNDVCLGLEVIVACGPLMVSALGAGLENVILLGAHLATTAGAGLESRIRSILSAMQGILEPRISVKAVCNVILELTAEQCETDGFFTFLFGALEGFLSAAKSTAVKTSNLQRICTNAILHGFVLVEKSKGDASLNTKTAVPVLVSAAVALMSRLVQADSEALLRELLIHHTFAEITNDDDGAWRTTPQSLRKVLCGTMLCKAIGETFQDAATPLYLLFYEAILNVLTFTAKAPPKPKRRRDAVGDDSSDATVELTVHLITAALQCVQSLATTDTGGEFLCSTGGRNNNVLQKTVDAVVPHLSSTATLGSAIHTVLIPTIEHLALCHRHGTAEGWGVLQRACFAFAGHDNPEVRRNVLLAVQRIYERVGERMGVLLRDALGPLGTLAEDPDPSVATATRDMVRVLSKVTGQSLTSFIR